MAENPTLAISAAPDPGLDSDGVLTLPCRRDSAFGDGRHPTTRLCVGAVDLLCRQLSRLRTDAGESAVGGSGVTTPASFAVLDVGTGTGVLARIARARGAGRVVGTDIDPAALESARVHAALDERTPQVARSGAGLPRIEVSSELPDHWGAVFDLVVANILEGPLKSLAPNLARSIHPGGELLISGFTRLQIPPLRAAFQTAGLAYVSESFLDEWALLRFKRP